MVRRSEQSLSGTTAYWERKALASPVTYIVEIEGMGYILIGSTRHLAEHLKTMQSECSERLILLRKIKGLEHAPFLKVKLARHRYSGALDMFRKTDEVVTYLNRYRRDDEFFQPVDHRPVEVKTLDQKFT